MKNNISKSANAKQGFRLDIQGLRGIAVLAVIIFHFFPKALPGGFAGVDIFFVISGFLMTGIAFRGFENNTFSLIQFYIARATRIVPALAALCLVLLVLGWFYLTPTEYRALGKHSLGSITFISNMMYWKESGYFDAASHTKWLLHTWSLSVEWQFYIFYPIMLMILKRFLPLNWVKAMIPLATVACFAFSAWYSYRNPTASYFLLPTRAWELLIGGVVYLYPLSKITKIPSKYLVYLGFALIIGSCFAISQDNVWPGYLAAFPVLGAFFIMQADDSENIITGNPVIQTLGKWSYSLYLWHWPFVVGCYIYGYQSVSSKLMAVLFAIIAGALSYYLVETRRQKFTMTNWKQLFKLRPLWQGAIVACAATAIFVTKGFYSHYPEQVRNIIAQEKNNNPRKAECNNGSNHCVYGKGEVSVIVLGDSHADTIVRAVEKVKPANTALLDLSKSACPFLFNNEQLKDKKWETACAKHWDESLKEIRSEYQGVPIVLKQRTMSKILGSNRPGKDLSENLVEDIKWKNSPKFNNRSQEWQLALATEMKNTICEFAKTNPVYVVRDNPELPAYVAKTMARKWMQGDKDYRVTLPRSEFLKRNELSIWLQDQAAKECGVKILDGTDLLCEKENCYGDKDGIPMYFDYNHLSLDGADLLLPLFKTIWEK